MLQVLTTVKLMCFALNLGKYVVVPLLVEWIELSSLVLLDTSICNHKWREMLLTLFQTFPIAFQKCVSSIPTEIPLSREFIEWLDTRCMDYSGLVNVGLSNSYLKNSRVRSLTWTKNASIIGCSEKNVTPLLNIFPFFENLERIVLEHCNYRTSEIVWSLSQNCCKLREFVLVGEAISSVVLIDLCRSNPNLSVMKAHLRNVNRHFCYALAIYCRQLKVVDIVSPATISSAVSALLLHCAKGLTKFSCCNSFSLPARQSSILLYYHGSTLSTLDLTVCSVPRPLQSSLGDFCPKLTGLDFNKYLENIDDTLADSFEKQLNLENLTSLNTEEFSIKDEQLCAVVRQSKLLRLAVNVGELTAVGFNGLIYIRELTLEGDCEYIGEIICTVGRTCKRLTTCSLLIESINIDNEFENFLKSTSDTLTSLFVNYFMGKERGMLAIARHCSRNLRTLKVRNFSGYCEGLKELMRCCRLNTLMLTPFVNSSMTETIATNGSCLTDLNICDVRLYLDTLKRLVKRLTRLRVLRVMISKESERALLSVNENLLITSDGYHVHPNY